jgi:hypothetical protein
MSFLSHQPQLVLLPEHGSPRGTQLLENCLGYAPPLSGAQYVGRGAARSSGIKGGVEGSVAVKSRRRYIAAGDADRPM